MAESRQIETPHLLIEPFTETYLTERYVGWLNDAEVVRYSEQRHRAHTLDECRVYMNSFEGSPNFFWAILLKEHGRHIGNINAYVNEANALADIGIMIGEKDVWGRGFASEAWIAVCKFLFRECGLRKLTAGTLSVNEGMLAIMKKAGMVDDGRRCRHYVWEGQQVDMVHAALFRDDWLTRFPAGPFNC